MRGTGEFKGLGRARRGQLAIEYLLVTGFQLALITILAGYGFLLYFDTVKNAQVVSSVDTITEGVNRAYSMGPGNVLIVSVTLPDGTTNSQVGTPTSYHYRFTIDGQAVQEIVQTHVSGNLPTTSGTYRIRIENVDSNVVVSVVP